MMAFAVIGVGIALYWNVYASQKADFSRTQLEAMSKKSDQHRHALAPTSRIVLPPFSSIHLPQLLDGASRKHGLALGAIAYSMEGGPRQPYQRYKATFSLSGSYTLQRAFIAEILSAPTAVALDSIICARVEEPNVALVCDISVSAFYARDVNG